MSEKVTLADLEAAGMRPDSDPLKPEGASVNLGDLEAASMLPDCDPLKPEKAHKWWATLLALALPFALFGLVSFGQQVVHH